DPRRAGDLRRALGVGVAAELELVLAGAVLPGHREPGAAERRLGARDLVGERAPAAGVADGILEDRLQRVVGAHRALAVRAPALGLDQEAEPAARREVLLREPRRRLVDREAGGRILVGDEARIERQRQVA